MGTLLSYSMKNEIEWASHWAAAIIIALASLEWWSILMALRKILTLNQTTMLVVYLTVWPAIVLVILWARQYLLKRMGDRRVTMTDTQIQFGQTLIMVDSIGGFHPLMPITRSFGYVQLHFGPAEKLKGHQLIPYRAEDAENIRRIFTEVYHWEKLLPHA